MCAQTRKADALSFWLTRCLLPLDKSRLWGVAVYDRNVSVLLLQPQACLIKDPKDRPSAGQMLQHDWLMRQLAAEAAGIPEARVGTLLLFDTQIALGWLLL